MKQAIATLSDWLRAVFGPVADQEERQERRRQRQRRRATYLATLGVDVGPRMIHGVVIAR